MHAMAVQMKYHAHKAKPPEEKQAPPPGIDMEAATRWMQGREGDLGEETLDLVSLFGIPAARSDVASDIHEAQSLRRAGYRVMKVVSPDALHKSNAGGVFRGGENSGRGAESRNHPENLFGTGRTPAFEGEGPTDAPESYDMFVAGSRSVLRIGGAVGMGGIFIEAFRTWKPLLPSDSRHCIRKDRAAEIVLRAQKARGKASGDIAAFIDRLWGLTLLAAFPQIQARPPSGEGFQPAAAPWRRCAGADHGLMPRDSSAPKTGMKVLNRGASVKA